MRFDRWLAAVPAMAATVLATSCLAERGPTDPDPGAVASIAILADGPPVVPVGGTLQLEAQPRNALGDLLPLSTVIWKSFQEEVAQVSPGGVVTGISEGPALITASAGGRTGSIALMVEIHEPPAAPSGLAGSPGSNTRIELTWDDNAENVEGYRVERGSPVPEASLALFVGVAEFVEVAELPAGARSFSDAGLSPATTYRYRVRACNPHGCSPYSDPVDATTRGTLTVTTASLPPGVANQPYGATLVAEGGDGQFGWNLVSGVLPEGLALAPHGEIAGTAPSFGGSSFTVRAESGDGQEATRELSLEIFSPLQISTELLPDGEVGSPYEQLLEAVGGDGSVRWTLLGGSLPPGLALESHEGLLHGIPAHPDAYRFTVRAESADGQTVAREFTLTIHPGPVAITTSALPGAIVGTFYAHSLAAVGGLQDYAWSVTGGALPPGLTLSSGSGLIAGPPTAAGSYPFTVRAASGDDFDDGTFSILVEAAVPSGTPVEIQNWYLPVGFVGEPYDYPVAVAGGDGEEYEFDVVAGSLPSGISILSDGTLAGTPDGSGTAHFALRVRSGGFEATRAFALSVSFAPPSGYNIAIVNVTGTMPSPAVRGELDEAVAKWESAITSDLGTFLVPALGILGSCLGHAGKLRPGEPIEDLAVFLDVAFIDGASPSGNILARASTCSPFDASAFPRVGAVQFDSADLDTFAGEKMRGLIIHEIGHVIGIGTIWDFPPRDFLIGEGGSNPRFVGASGIAAYHSLGGSDANIPVETNEFPPGTADAHWRESVFDHEVMTGFIENSAFMPLSRMSIAALGDLGYSVNLGAADAYAIPAPGAPGAAAEPGTRIPLNDVVVEPIYILNGDGTVEQIVPR